MGLFSNTISQERIFNKLANMLAEGDIDEWLAQSLCDLCEDHVSELCGDRYDRYSSIDRIELLRSKAIYYLKQDLRKEKKDEFFDEALKIYNKNQEKNNG